MPQLFTFVLKKPKEITMIAKIISGGQAGADRAGLDVAIRHGFPHGGWCPKGRKAEDGTIGGQYQLVQTLTDDSLQHTEWNVRDSDGTVVFTLGMDATGASMRAADFAKMHGKPCIHISPTGDGFMDPAVKLQRFVLEHGIHVLNVAGSRESEEQGIYRWVWQVIDDAFFWNKTHGDMLGGPGEG